MNRRAPKPCRVPLSELGTAPDRELAERYDSTVAAVRYWRKKRGVPAFRAQSADPDRVDEVLGQWTDETAAALLDVSPQTARRWRIDRGLPPAGSDLWSIVPAHDSRGALVRDLAEWSGRRRDCVDCTLRNWLRAGRVVRELVEAPTGKRGPQRAYAYRRAAG